MITLQRASFSALTVIALFASCQTPAGTATEGALEGAAPAGAVVVHATIGGIT